MVIPSAIGLVLAKHICNLGTLSCMVANLGRKEGEQHSSSALALVYGSHQSLSPLRSMDW